MEYVVNNIVKMQWDKAGWLQANTRGKKEGRFILASQDYTNSEGKVVSVIFTDGAAFVLADDWFTPQETIWTAKEVISYVKREKPGNFPYDCLDSYYPIIEAGDSEVSAVVVEHLHLEQHVDDIKARLEDIAPYGYEQLQTF